MRGIPVLLALVPLALIVAVPATAQRAEVPVRLVVGQGGVRRYAVTVTINGQPVEAGLDTGSTGLRVLAPSLPGGDGLKGARSDYSYGSGTRFGGRAVTVAVAFGSLAPANVRVQRIDSLGCTEAVPDCPSRHTDLARFGIQGDGVQGQGFPAILGIGLRDDPVANPLIQSGVARWIVELPRTPGETGRLVLNPADDEVARYRRIRFIAGTNQVAGCIVSAGTKLCAPAMVDTGANGIRVQGGRPRDILADGTQASLVIGDGRTTAALPVTIGRRDQASGMRLYPARGAGQVSLSFGIAPYLRWSVMYDANAHTIGVADRP